LTLHYLIGDATKPVREPAIIAHVCNDVGAFSQGFVQALNILYPVVKKRYQSLKGQYTLGLTQIIKLSNGVHIANMIAQKGLGRDKDGKPPIRYEALNSSLAKVNEYAQNYGLTLHMPRIGSVRSGGDWDKIEAIIKDTMRVDTYVYTLESEKDNWKGTTYEDNE